jgi:DNA-binding CsgD family transcriptional regulator
MLLGREAECEAVEQLLDRARHGRSGSLLVSGEAGIGKSTLLAHAAASASGFRVLRATGREAEAELSFAGLSDIFRPVLSLIGEIPPPQAAALAGALALWPPVPGDRFTVAASTLSLLAAAADVPVLVLADDAHWLDAASREALLFAARRLGEEGVAMLFAVRTGEGDDFRGCGLDQVRLRGLGPAASAAMLRGGTGRVVDRRVAERLGQATGGNPLAMLEIARLLSDEELAGAAILNELPAAAEVEKAFRRRISILSPPLRQALVVAAVAGSLPFERTLAACAVLELAPEVFERAQAHGIISIENGRLDFCHPIVRSVVQHDAERGALRAAHRALAAVLRAEEWADRRAWHCGEAATCPDAEASDALERSAFAAAARNTPMVSAARFQRAAELAPDPDRRGRLLVEAARQWQLLGRADQSLPLLDQQLTGPIDASQRADIQHLRAAAEASRGHVSEAGRLLVDEAARIAAVDPAKAVRMLIDACGAIMLSGHVSVAVPVARRCYALAENLPGPLRDFAAITLGSALVLHGEARAARPLVAGTGPVYDGDKALILQGVQGLIFLWLDDYPRASAEFDRLCEGARACSAPSLLCPGLARRSSLHFRLGNWLTASADAAEALRLAQETRQDLYVGYSLAFLARIEAACGAEEPCYRHAMQALELAQASGMGSVRSYALAALGQLELGLSRFDAAIRHLEELSGLHEAWEMRHPTVIQSTPDLIDAYVHAGRLDDARRQLDAFADQASCNDSRPALAAACRSEGVLAPAGRFSEWFERALALHDRTPIPFDLGRTELWYGQRLRRDRQKNAAREHLESAREIFDRLGARPWGHRARSELRALGVRVRNAAPLASAALTPQELRVAMSVSKGATNREASGALFLSPRTIEAHLSRVYRKLGVRSRTELAALLARDGTLDGLAGAHATAAPPPGTPVRQLPV